jgi:hypothetical protein
MAGHGFDVPLPPSRRDGYPYSGQREGRIDPMISQFRMRWLLPLAALGLVATLAGCIAYPAYPVYPGYGYGYAGPYYGGGYGWGHGGGWHH